jgi:hypothetical protein
LSQAERISEDIVGHDRQHMISALQARQSERSTDGAAVRHASLEIIQRFESSAKNAAQAAYAERHDGA